MLARLGIVLLATLLAPSIAVGFALEPPISLAPYGGGVEGSTGNVVALTPTSFLVATAGPDTTIQTADDQILHVAGIDGVPVITPFATPNLPKWSRVTRLSATRAAVIHAGADATFRTADDGVFLLLGIGTTNQVTSVTTGAYDNPWDYAMPVPFGPEMVVVAGDGPDTVNRTADDVLHVITGIGTTNTVTTVPAPFNGYQPRASRISPTSLLSMSYGPDANPHTADDVTYLFTDVGATNARTDLATPYRTDGRPGQGLRLTPTTVLIAGTGPDETWRTGDDQLLLIDDLGGTNTVTTIPTPNLIGWSPAAPRRLSATRAVVSHAGPDATESTADDGIYLIDDLGGANQVTSLTLGALGDGPACGLQPLTPSTGALVSFGPDTFRETADDEIVIVSDLFGANTVTRVPMAGLTPFTPQRPTVLGPTSFLLWNGGPDALLGGSSAVADDRVALVGGVGTAPFVLELPAGETESTGNLAARPEILGRGRAAFSTSGPDHFFGGGSDDAVRVLTNLDLADALDVTKLTIKATAKGEKASVKGTLRIESGALTLGDVDAVVSIGPAAEILPASGFESKGSKIQYKAPKGSGGLISKLTWKPEKGTLVIKAGGTGTGLEDTDPAHVPVAIELLALSREEGLYLADGVTGTQSGTKIKFKAPKD